MNFILGYSEADGATKSAIEFIQDNIDLIDEGKWEDFFWNMIDNPAGWTVSHPTSKVIIGMLHNAKIVFDDSVREKVLYEALNNTICAIKDSEIEKISLHDLYYVNDGTTKPKEDMGNWLGYSKEEFFNFIIVNPSLKLKLIEDTKNIFSTLFEVL